MFIFASIIINVFKFISITYDNHMTLVKLFYYCREFTLRDCHAKQFSVLPQSSHKVCPSIQKCWDGMFVVVCSLVMAIFVHKQGMSAVNLLGITPTLSGKIFQILWVMLRTVPQDRKGWDQAVALTELVVALHF